MPATRIFNGRAFIYYGAFAFESDIRDEVRAIRRQGYYTRVTRGSGHFDYDNGHFTIWIRKIEEGNSKRAKRS